jgi:predicted dithiol-disulfide oxidoreductase (DUF899 family)
LQGTVRLSELFAGKADLILIHNMGTTCPNCTLWADASEKRGHSEFSLWLSPFV